MNINLLMLQTGEALKYYIFNIYYFYIINK